jgi:uncharacterized membrane protein
MKTPHIPFGAKGSALLVLLLGIACSSQASTFSFKARAIDSTGPVPCDLRSMNKLGRAVGGCRLDSNSDVFNGVATKARGKSIHLVDGLGGQTNTVQQINDASTMVGYANLAGNTLTHAWVKPAGSAILDLGTLGGSNSYAKLINNKGLIVGSSQLSGNATSHIFVVQPGTTVMLDIGHLGANTFAPFAVNDKGVIAGSGSTQIDTHALLSAPPYDQILDLGTLGGTDSTAHDINNHGVVVGYSNLSDDTTTRAFVARGPDYHMTELAAPAGLSTWANSINSHELSVAWQVNDKGQILARDRHGNPYLLLPQ